MSASVRFITGPIHSGKTTRLLENFRESQATGRSDGFALLAVSADEQPLGYDLLHLATGDRVPAIRLIQALPPGWQESFRFSRFSFSVAGLRRADEILEESARRGVKRFFIDEIGLIELSGQGFSTLFERALREFAEVDVACRDTFLDAVIERFGIRAYTVLRAGAED